MIGILASTTVVAFNGVQNRANDTAVQNDLRNFASIMKQEKAINSTYPATLSASMGIKFSRGSYGLDFQSYNARYCRDPAADEFIFYANSKSGNYFRYVSTVGKVESATATYGWGVCSQIGLTSTNPSANGLNNTTWAAWVN